VYAEELKRALAEYTGVPPEYIVTGCGSDDVLDSALRALAQPGDCIAFPDPTFAMLPLFAAANGLTPHAVSLGAGAAVDVDALTHSGVAITYLCSPNNPTGATLPREVVESVIARAHGVVIVDEAYIEFGGESAIDLAQAYEHVLVTRTLSKAFGLAGLRVGYAVGSPTLVAAVEKARGPYKVSLPAERAAIAALRHDASWVREHVDAVRVNRVRFAEAASALPGIQALPSAANFVLLRLEPTMGSAAPAALGACELTRRLRARGVAVRPFPALPGVGEAVRVTIGPWEMMDACLAALCAELQCA
jgi:histidinol-phosphate aminotransferase